MRRERREVSKALCPLLRKLDLCSAPICVPNARATEVRVAVTTERCRDRSLGGLCALACGGNFAGEVFYQ